MVESHGEPDAAAAVVRAGGAALVGRGARSWRGWRRAWSTLGWLGLVRLDCGWRDAARAVFVELEALVDRLPEGALPAAPALAFLGIASERLGDRGRAAHTLRRLSAYAGQHHYMLIDRVLGMLAAVGEAWDDADAHFAAAADQAGQHGLWPELGLTLLESARVRLGPAASGERARGLAEAREALALFADLGMARGEAEARALLASAPADHRTPLPPRTPGSLTARQIEVLRLVADGKPKREIAGTLGVSEKTVMNHVAAIFNKTGVDNRTAATAFACRHGLIQARAAPLPHRPDPT